MNIEDVQELEVSLSSTSQIDAELSNIGLQGYSAYEVAVQNGYVGTEQQWLASLKGADGVVSETQIQQIETTIEQKIETKGYVKDASYNHTDNNYTTQEKTKLASLSNYDDSSIRTLINSKANTSDVPSKTSQLTNDSNFIDNTYHDTSKQNTLISGTNIKTINNQSILGEGNITISGGGSGGTSDYNELSNLPSINSITLSGNKTLSQLGIQPSGNYLTNESDPTVPNHVKSITQDNITSWNNKSTFSGSYNDLTNKPNIPTKTSELENDSDFLTSSIGVKYYKQTSNSMLDIDKYFKNDYSPVIVNSNGINHITLKFYSEYDEGNITFNLSTYIDCDDAPSIDSSYETPTLFIMWQQNGIQKEKRIIMTSIGNYNYNVEDLSSLKFINYVEFTKDEGIGAFGTQHPYCKVNIDTRTEATMNGSLTFSDESSLKVEFTPTEDNDVINKKYVDDTIGNINTVLATLTTVEEGE